MSNLLLVLLVVCLHRSIVVAQSNPPLNFLVFIVDDMGYGDLSCYGRQNISSPNVDRLAAEGFEMNSWY